MSEFTFSKEELKHIEKIKKRYLDNNSLLIPVLWMIQEKQGWISEESMAYVGELLNIPLSTVKGVASFYTMFNKKPKGKFQLQVCTNVSCMLRGAYEIFNYISERLGIKNNETTEDGLFSLEEVECLGSCATAPVMQVNNQEYYENLTKEKVDELLEKFRSHLVEK